VSQEFGPNWDTFDMLGGVEGGAIEKSEGVAGCTVGRQAHLVVVEQVIVPAWHFLV